MSEISITQFRGKFTQAVAGSYKEKIGTTNFLRSMFKTVTNGTKLISIEVQRGTEKVAVDVLRGTEGNMNQATRSTQKIIEPYMFDEKINVTSIDGYDEIYVQENGKVNAEQAQNMIKAVTDELLKLNDKIQRAEELKCAEILEDGIVTSSVTENIDFKRKAESKVDLGAGNYWTEATIDPREACKAGAEFIRKEANIQSPIYNLILGSEMSSALMQNPQFKDAGWSDFDLIEAGMTGVNSSGAAPLCKFKAGSYIIYAWTYPQFYTNSAGTKVPFINDKKAILLPKDPNLTYQYGAVPAVLGNGKAIVNTKGQQTTYDYVDVPKAGHYHGIRSASIPVPLAIDSIYTFQGVA